MKKEFNIKNQLEKNPVQDVMDSSDILLAADYAMIGGHPGYVDDELFKLTTLSLERPGDAAMCMSPVIRKWIEENDIELITYYDLAE